MGFTVLVVDDEENARSNLEAFLTPLGYEVIGVGTLSEARVELQKGNCDVVLLDVQLPDGFGPNLLYETLNMNMRPPMILITGFPDIEIAVDAMRNGAHDFLIKPIKLDRLELSIQRAIEIVKMRRELALFRDTQKNSIQFVSGNSAQMKSVLNQAERAASMSVSVLITGETGVGKDVLANYIHSVGPRSHKMFVAINCAAIQSTMLESELFGHESGAFTGADKRKHGLMETADDGVLFLDEISSMPLDMQAKLLRAIESKNFRRVGGNNQINVDVQIVAASNRNLESMIEKNEFRSDLFYRLKVVDLHVPALRDRKEDIPELVGFFIKQKNAKMGVNILDITPRTMEKIMAYNWPGNIRELSNAIESAMLFCDTGVIDLPNLPLNLQ
ncbi:MAG TPA: sigma-54 dependent transcriptional regulator [Anaerolineaceae bacterium]|nr:sigma-54 dependent transcriptional regulator [Anaerolineaceae bacterium]